MAALTKEQAAALRWAVRRAGENSCMGLSPSTAKGITNMDADAFQKAYAAKAKTARQALKVAVPYRLPWALDAQVTTDDIGRAYWASDAYNPGRLGKGRCLEVAEFMMLNLARCCLGGAQVHVALDNGHKLVIRLEKQP